MVNKSAGHDRYTCNKASNLDKAGVRFWRNWFKQTGALDRNLPEPLFLAVKMWEESDDECVFSSKEVGRKEAKKTSEALKETERSLYEINFASQEIDIDSTLQQGNLMDEDDIQNEVAEVSGEKNAEPDPYDEIRRFQELYRKDFNQGSDGAAGSSLNEKEINQWKKAFPYIRVCGNAVMLPDSSDKTVDDNIPGISTSEWFVEKNWKRYSTKLRRELF